MGSSTFLTPGARILFFLALASIILWGMSNLATYINSTALAILIVLACGPVVDWLRAHRLPNWANLLITLGICVVILASFVVFMVYAAVQFAELLPTYQAQAQAQTGRVQETLTSLGLSGSGAAAIADLVNLAAPLNQTQKILDTLGNLFSSSITLLLLFVFLFVDVILFPGRLAWQGSQGHSYAHRVWDFTGDMRQYIIVMVILGVIVGVLNSILFIVIGVDLPILWGVLSGLLNFIPFIGFWFALIPPAILTYLEYGPQRMLLMAGIYILINAIVSNVIQPRLVVTRLNLTPFFNLVSCTFWPIVLGPMGAVIGVPLTMAVHSLLLDVDPSTRWMAAMMTATTPDKAQAESQADGATLQ